MSVTWTWNEYSTDNTGPNLVIKKCVWADTLGMFVAVGTYGTGNVNSIFTSTNGTTWTLRSAAEANQWVSVTWSSSLGVLVAVSTGGTHRVMTSTNGTAWSTATAAEANAWQDVVWAGGSVNRFVAVANGGTHRVMTSVDGTNWLTQTASSAQNWSGIAWNGTQLVAIAASTATTTNVMSSTTATAWSDQTIFSAATFRARSIAWAVDLGLFLAWATIGGTQHVIRSTTGASWADWAGNPSGWSTSNGNQIAWSHELGIAVATSGSSIGDVLTSTDGITWADVNTDPTYAFAHDGSDAIGYSPTLSAFAFFPPSPARDVAILGVGSAASDSISPTSGNVAGGATLTITSAGVNGGFTAGTRVFFYNPSVRGPFTPATDWFGQEGLPFDIECQSVVISDTGHLTCLVPVNYFSVMTVGVVAINTNLAPTPNITCYLPGGFTYSNPVITSLTPALGPLDGGQVVTITGTNLFGFNGTNDNRQILTIGGTEAGNVIVTSPTTITAITPPGAGGLVDVVLQAIHVNGVVGVGSVGYNTFTPSTLAASYEYDPMWEDGNTIVTQLLAPGPGWKLLNGLPFILYIEPTSGSNLGGDTVQIVGVNLSQGATVTFGGNSAAVLSISGYPLVSVLCTTPAHASGAVDVVVTNPDTSSNTLVKGFTYTSPPATISFIYPVGGTTTGGTTLTIKGTGFIAPAQVLVGNLYGLSPTVVNAETITCTTPVHTAGTFDVQVISS